MIENNSSLDVKIIGISTNGSNDLDTAKKMKQSDQTQSVKKWCKRDGDNLDGLSRASLLKSKHVLPKLSQQPMTL